MRPKVPRTTGNLVSSIQKNVWQNDTHKEFKESNKTNQSQDMGQGSHQGTKFGPGFHHGPQEKWNEKQANQDRGIPDDGSDCNDSNTNKGTGSKLTIRIREGFHKHVCYNDDDCHADRPYNLGKDDGLPTCSRDVTWEFFRRVTQLLFLITSDHSSRKPAVAVPTACLGPWISTRHPAQKFPVINDEIGERKLVRIEKEWRDAEW